jgi:magnesium chelatase subunit D
LLPPTNSVDLAERRLAALPAGGRTPLAAGLDLAALVLEGHGRAAAHTPLLILVSDGRANVAPHGGDPWEQALRAAGHLRRRGYAAAVVDTAGGGLDLGLGRTLAAALGAVYVRLDGAAQGALQATSPVSQAPAAHVEPLTPVPPGWLPARWM